MSNIKLSGNSVGHPSPGKSPPGRGSGVGSERPSEMAGGAGRTWSIGRGAGLQGMATDSTGATKLCSEDWRIGVPGFEQEGTAPLRG